jgi:hypothetical protein
LVLIAWFPFLDGVCFPQLSTLGGSIYDDVIECTADSGGSTPFE